MNNKTVALHNLRKNIESKDETTRGEKKNRLPTTKKNLKGDNTKQ